MTFAVFHNSTWQLFLYCKISFVNVVKANSCQGSSRPLPWVVNIIKVLNGWISPRIVNRVCHILGEIKFVVMIVQRNKVI